MVADPTLFLRSEMLSILQLVLFKALTFLDKKRLYYGFDSSQAPPIPRGARSLRRGPLRKKVVDNKLCAFDLLATVADKILLEENSPTTASSDGACQEGSNPGIVKEEQQLDDHKLTDIHNQTSLEIGIGVVEIQNHQGGFSSGSASAITNSGCTDKTGFDEKKPSNHGSSQSGCSLKKQEGFSTGYTVFDVPLLENHGDRRIKKLLAPRCSKASPKLTDRDLSDTGVQMHAVYQNRKRGSKFQRSQRMYPFKKRKLLYNLPSNSDDTTHCDYEDIYEPLEKATDISASDFANKELSKDAGESTIFTSRESHVKLRIKSFRVPELFIELPETATIGSLKKTVMDAITTLIGSGLHIGVLVQGRKIKDDSTTLLQSGISHNNKVDTLGFTLEPNPSQIHKPICSEEPLSSSYAGKSVDKAGGDSKALATVPESNVQALTMLPPPLQKSKRSETAQRRIRRPFSVSEVEALVQAVEELGTGRWRDVKMRAFDNINHRTYVDLKDKWKTLVHTARISPQQRRGEPVPQELLDRVLAAHSYWSHQLAKHQTDTCLLL